MKFTFKKVPIKNFLKKIELKNSKEKHIISVQIFTGKSKEVPLPVFTDLTAGKYR